MLPPSCLCVQSPSLERPGPCPRLFPSVSCVCVSLNRGPDPGLFRQSTWSLHWNEKPCCDAQCPHYGPPLVTAECRCCPWRHGAGLSQYLFNRR